jgi:hypothetical protein
MGHDSKIILKVPRAFKPPVVTAKDQGVAAFHKYDWYFKWMEEFMKDVNKVFLTPCAQTKPIYTSSLHRCIYQKYVRAHGMEREVFVVSEPVTLILYQDLYDLEKYFCYEFIPKLLSPEARELFVGRLRGLLKGKDIEGCLPSHHAALINDAVGENWKNYWQGDMLDMKKRANHL